MWVKVAPDKNELMISGIVYIALIDIVFIALMFHILNLVMMLPNRNQAISKQRAVVIINDYGHVNHVDITWYFIIQRMFLIIRCVVVKPLI